MAASNITNHGPIRFVQSTNQKGPFSESRPERAGQTFKAGTPVQPFTAAPGLFVQAWDGQTVANGIWGIALANGSNLPTNGAGAPTGYSQVGPPRAIATYGSVQNQSAAINIAPGTPVSDGRTLFQQADENTIFEATYDNSQGNVAADYTPNPDMEGTAYGLTLDPNGYWFVDGSVTGNNAVAKIVGANPVYGFGQVNGLVRFKILTSARFDN